MTTPEMIDKVLLEYDLNGSGAVAGFERSEVLEFLEKAQLETVQEGVLSYGPEIFETLITHYIDILAASTLDGLDDVYTCSIPASPGKEYLFYINSKTLLTRSAYPKITTNGWIENRLIKKENSAKYTQSDSNKPIMYNIPIYVADGKFYVTKDWATTIYSSDTANFVLWYIKRPTILTDVALSTSELSERWHQTIADKALKNMLLVTNDARIRQATANPKKSN